MKRKLLERQPQQQKGYFVVVRYGQQGNPIPFMNIITISLTSDDIFFHHPSSHTLNGHVVVVASFPSFYFLPCCCVQTTARGTHSCCSLATGTLITLYEVLYR